ncbi:MAG: hypothetical protein J6T17_07455 [Clostridia bacterium]|nr:hypothetical protein [Clostridia bacterium]
MSGIYIKGMEMPTICKSCRFCGFGGKMGELNVCMFTGESQPTLSRERMSNCPLVPVPPHGRLIDADTMVKSVMSQYDILKAFNNSELSELADVLVRGVLQEIENAPTIIPADPAEEGE